MLFSGVFADVVVLLGCVSQLTQLPVKVGSVRSED